MIVYPMAMKHKADRFSVPCAFFYIPHICTDSFNDLERDADDENERGRCEEGDLARICG